MYVYETNGQYLAQYLLDHHLDGGGERWNGLGVALLASNRSSEWLEAVQEMVSLQLVRRLISAGEVLLARHGLLAAEVEIKQLIIDTMLVHWGSAGDIYERLLPAVRSARESINESTRRSIEALAKREMPYCYLCGTELNFAGDDYRSLTLDHVWPRAYGGDSDFENLLGACQSCNGTKASEPSWAMYPIQSLMAGYDVQDLGAIPKTMRFAVQARAAKQLARNERLSLREAYMRLGRPGPPLVLSGATAVDVFNLSFSAAEEIER